MTAYSKQVEYFLFTINLHFDHQTDPIVFDLLSEVLFLFCNIWNLLQFF